ncbi:GNAT family N-acetyltransferase [Candidatus Dependentiae bacterium]|nr:MAG: GNAT family N-acetyltransferase [Candidatus Dependentiae bacterium]
MILTKQIQWFKITIIVTTIGLLGIGSWYLYHIHKPQEQILDFDDLRDTTDILTIFKRDWYWLVASEDYSPEFMLKYRAPTQDFRYMGQLNIKVLRNQDGLLIGFVAYYLKTATEGLLLFLDVNPSFRSKGYSEQLLTYALNDLKKLGANIVHLVTRTNNIHAINLYQHTNFTETSRTDGFVYFAKQLSS